MEYKVCRRTRVGFYHYIQVPFARCDSRRLWRMYKAYYAYLKNMSGVLDEPLSPVPSHTMIGDALHQGRRT